MTGAAHGNDILAIQQVVTDTDTRGLSPEKRVVLSRDGGRTFKVLPESPKGRPESVIHDGTHFWVSFDHPLKIHRFEPGKPMLAVATAPADFTALRAAGAGALVVEHGFRREGLRFALSRDQGTTWKQFAGPVAPREREFDRPTLLAHAEGLFYCSSGGVFISTDQGSTWRERAKVPCGVLQIVDKRLVVAGPDGAWLIDGDQTTRLATACFLGVGRTPGGLVAIPRHELRGSLGTASSMRAVAVITPDGVATIATHGDTVLPDIAWTRLTEKDYIGQGFDAKAARQLAANEAPRTGFPDFTAILPDAVITFNSGGITRIPLAAIPTPTPRTWRLPSAPLAVTTPPDFDAEVVKGLLVIQSIARQYRIALHVANDTPADFETGVQKLLTTSNCGPLQVVEARREVGTGPSLTLIRSGTCVTGLGFGSNRVFIVRLPNVFGAFYAMVIIDSDADLDPGPLIEALAKSLQNAAPPTPNPPTFPAWKPLPVLKSATALVQTPAALLALTPKGLLRSTDGAQFTPTALPNAVLPTEVAVFDSNVWAATATGDLFKSIDHGLTWTPAGAVFEGARLVGAHDLGPVLALVEGETILLLLPADASTGAPTTPTRTSGWAGLKAGVPGTRLDFFSGHGGAFAVETDRGAFTSMDTGHTWTSYENNVGFTGVSFAPAKAWLATTAGLQRPANNAWSWILTFASSAPPMQAAIPFDGVQMVLSPSGALVVASDGQLRRVAVADRAVPSFARGKVGAVGPTVVALAPGGAFSLTVP